MFFWRANCPVLGILKHLVLGHILLKKNCLVYIQALFYATVDSGGRTLARCGWGSHAAPSQVRFNSKQEVRTETVKWTAVCLLIEIMSSAQIWLLAVFLQLPWLCETLRDTALSTAFRPFNGSSLRVLALCTGMEAFILQIRN